MSVLPPHVWSWTVRILRKRSAREQPGVRLPMCESSPLGFSHTQNRDCTYMIWLVNLRDCDYMIWLVNYSEGSGVCSSKTRGDRKVWYNVNKKQYGSWRFKSLVSPGFLRLLRYTSFVWTYVYPNTTRWYSLMRDRRDVDLHRPATCGTRTVELSNSNRVHSHLSCPTVPHTHRTDMSTVTYSETTNI